MLLELRAKTENIKQSWALLKTLIGDKQDKQNYSGTVDNQFKTYIAILPGVDQTQPQIHCQESLYQLSHSSFLSAWKTF